MAEKKDRKLNYVVKKDAHDRFERRKTEGDAFGMDHIDVLWTHPDGFPADTISVPVSHPPDIRYESREVGPRKKELIDQVSVQHGTADHVVLQMLEEKRERIAKATGVEL